MSATFHTTEAEIQQEVRDVLHAQGWEVLSRKEMNELRGPTRMNEAVVEPLLVEAILKLNADADIDVETAREIAAQVRRINSDRVMLDVLRDGLPYKPAPDQPTLDIRVLDTDDPSQNSYVATDEFVIRTGGHRDPRLDVVCLVNGLPLGIIENKDMDEPVDVAARDWAGYWQDLPQLVALSSVVGCCNGLKFRVGPSGLTEADGYGEWSDPWPQTVADKGDEMLVGLSAFHPETLIDLAANFVIFETREGVTTKKLARTHQYRAANKLVQRVLDGNIKRGIVWHATGSGKSLTMLFAARKLLRVGLGNPTVLIIIDRRELDEQINETLTACEFDGVKQPKRRTALRELLAGGGGGVIVTTAQKFDESMAGLLKGDNVIAFVDEAHRSQFGDFGMFMRSALPGAFLFGFTGTPVEQGGSRSTRRNFSYEVTAGVWEPYLDRYGFAEAIADKATVPVAYEPRLPAWKIPRTTIEVKFQELTDGLPEKVREALADRATKEKVVAKAPDRVAAIAADIAEQLRDRVAPFAGLAVALDREACALLADALKQHMRPEEYAVVMSRSKKDASVEPGAPDLRDWYPATEWTRLYGTPPAEDETEEDEDAGAGEEFLSKPDRGAIKDFIKRLKNPDDPMKLLIVNSMLLTGFDAPPIQAMFLDRGLHDHTLMQAIARTNRRYANKSFGLVFDYWGVFDDLKDALKEFAADDLDGLVEDTSELIKRFPQILDDALAIVEEAPGSGRKRMLWVVRRFNEHPEEAQRFRDLVEEAQDAWETLSPDPRLLSYRPRYQEVLEVWLAWRRGMRSDLKPGSTGLGRKTEKLVQEAIGFERMRDELPAHTIDAEFLERLKNDEELTPGEKATDIEGAVVHEASSRGTDDPRAKALLERLAALRRKQQKNAQMTLDGLREWEELVSDYVAEEEQVENLGLDEPGGLTFQSLRRAAPTAPEEQLLEVSRAMSAHFEETAGFDGWSERDDVVQGLRRAVISELVKHTDTRRLAAEPQVVDDLLAALTTIERAQS